MNTTGSYCKVTNDILAVNICQKEKEKEYYECLQDMRTRENRMKEAYCMSRAYNHYLSCININTPKYEKSNK